MGKPFSFRRKAKGFPIPFPKRKATMDQKIPTQKFFKKECGEKQFYKNVFPRKNHSTLSIFLTFNRKKRSYSSNSTYSRNYIKNVTNV